MRRFLILAYKATAHLIGTAFDMLLGLVPSRFASLVAERLVFARTSPRGARYFAVNELVWRRFTGIGKGEPLAREFLNEINSGDCIWDIGANIGSFCSMIKNGDVNLVCFEASPLNLNLLAKVLMANRFKNAQIIVGGFGLQPEKFLSINSNERIGVADDFSRQRQPHEPTFQVPGVMELPSDIPLPDFIKIDVDGAERMVLDQLKIASLLSRVKGVYIEIEAKHFDYCNGILQRNDFFVKGQDGENYWFSKIVT